MANNIEQIIQSRPRDLGGFNVRRILPYAKRRMVGPFIFFDHMGPAEFPPGQGINVRPHPHINLATVTYLFKGKIHHRDSLGSDQMIEPGAINWMTAGRGIVHSERNPEDLNDKTHALDGLQCWVALPEEHEESEPQFSHHPKDSLPAFSAGDSHVRLLLGEAFGHQSPVPVHSDLFYADLSLPSQGQVILPSEQRERALYLADGELTVQGEAVQRFSMVVFDTPSEITVTAREDSRFVILGGSPVGERHIQWNFVSSQKDRIKEAAKMWSHGPASNNERFPTVPGDDQEWIPLPAELNTEGNIL